MKIKKKIYLIAVLFMLSILTPGFDVKIKDIGSFAGVRENQLIGYGIVVGLEGTGDTTQNKFTFQTIANYLEKMGITIAPTSFQMRNTAAVAITAILPPFPRVGQQIDLTVSSIGSAKSLQGGILLIVPLRGPMEKFMPLVRDQFQLGDLMPAREEPQSEKIIPLSVESPMVELLKMK